MKFRQFRRAFTFYLALKSYGFVQCSFYKCATRLNYRFTAALGSYRLYTLVIIQPRQGFLLTIASLTLIFYMKLKSFLF